MKRAVVWVFRSRRRRRDARGAAALEFALVVVPLVSLLMGIVTFGLGYSNYVALNNAVREGARMGASTANAPAWGSAVTQQTSTIYADVTNPLPATNVCGLLISKTGGATPLYATKQTSDPSCDPVAGNASAGPPPATPANLPDGCFVKVWARLPVDMNWAFFHVPITLRAQSVALYDRSQLCP